VAARHYMKNNGAANKNAGCFYHLFQTHVIKENGAFVINFVAGNA
jgi:hypothetical protein